MIQSLQKRVALCLEIICCFGPSGCLLYLLHNKNTPSDAESREVQDDGKHKSVGGTTAKLWSDFHKGVVINTEEK